ncbi:MAG: BrnT family toxin [Coriobacteriia bacterium]|nr:BrnT family toxin [Coriobacteriia bacterium]
MRFEFDPKKGVANKARHGIDFFEAQSLWLDEDYVEVEAHSETGQRFVVIGMIGMRHCSALITYKDEVIQIISVRRSREGEVEIYESRRAG